MITTSAQFNEYSDASSGLKFQAYKPSLEHALEKYIIPVLGQQYYTELVALNNPNQDQTKLIVAIKKAWVSFTLYEYSLISSVIQTDGGLRRGSSEDMPTAYKYQEENYRKSILDRAFLSLETAIQYLEILVRNGSANTWSASDQFSNYRSLMLNSGTEFASIMTFVKYPRRLFLLLSNSIYNTQIFTIYQTLAADVYYSLFNKIKTANPNLTAEEKELMIRIKHAIAHLAFANGITAVLTSIDENGIHVLSNGSDSNSSVSKRVTADNTIIDRLIVEHNRIGELWLGKIVDYLKEKASPQLWPGWQTVVSTDEYIPSGLGMI